MGIRSMLKVQTPILVCVVILELECCSIYSGKVTVRGEVKDIKETDKWSPQSYIQPDATRLFEEIVRSIKATRKEYDVIIVSMPGTIKQNKEIITSSRLGIKRAFSASNFISERLNNARVCIAHDIDCMLIGAQYGLDNIEITSDETICYIVADEGVGAAIMINGKIHHGAGIAGHISRLVLDENGRYYPELSQSGPLESYVSRPWVSRRCVERYGSSFEFSSTTTKKTPFQKALAQALSDDQYRNITYELLSSGVQEKNKIALECLQDAAKYLSKAINSIIAISHPHKILFAGRMITDIEEFYNNVIDTAKKSSWATAWNAVFFDKRNDSRTDQIIGSFGISKIEKWEDVL